MIRLGGTIEGVLARLKEKTFELDESVDLGWFEGSTMMSKLRAFPSGGTRSLIEMYANVNAARARGTLELFAESGNKRLAAFAVDASETARQVFLELGTEAGNKKRILLEVLENGQDISHFLTRFASGAPSAQFNRINWGTSTVNFAASTGSSITNVTHGLGQAPTGAICMAVSSPAFTQIPIFNLVALEKTTFGVNAETKAAVTGNLSFFWVAFL